MAEDAADQAPPISRAHNRSGQRIGCWASLIMLLILSVGVGVLWLSRERIAGNVIASALKDRGITATYEIERIGTRTQILRNIVVGDPRRPDLVIKRALVRINPRFGFPTLGRITLIEPRLYGTYRNGRLSFGALDPLLFPPKTEKPFALPDLDLAIEDGRGLLESDFGPIGMKIAGNGNLQNGFTGEVAAIAPQLTVTGCQGGRTSAYGQVEIRSSAPIFRGPLRFDQVRCPASGVAVRSGAVQLTVGADKTLAKIEGLAVVRSGAVDFPRGNLAGLTGQSRFTWRDHGLTARFDLAVRDVASDQARLGRLGFNGTLRARRDFARIELDTRFSGNRLQLGRGFDASLARAVTGSRDTLIAPLLNQLRQGLAREGRTSSLAGQLTLRRTGDRLAVSVPNVSVRGSSGATLLALTRFQLSDGPSSAPQASGNIATGGAGLPRIVGNLTLQNGGGVEAKLAMAEYTAGTSRLAIPDLVIVQRDNGTIGFVGTALASGILPGGYADNLVLPITGNWSRGGALALWRECTSVRFDRLRYANLTLGRQGLTLCPSSGSPILQYDGRGVRFAAGAPAVQLAGMLGQTPIAIRSGPIGFAHPGSVSARRLEVTLGPAENAQRFLIADLTARIGSEITGQFAGTDVRLFSVPLDVLNASGAWRYAGGKLTLFDGDFQLQDRLEPDRFEPLVGHEATLTLADNVVTADTILREPKTNREVTRAVLRHDLATGTGRADLLVAGITFGPGFQPTQLTSKTFGVVANVKGTVSGTGRVDWNEQGVTSTGKFSSKSLDFAAAFGPVKGASGTVEFTDLLGLTTAPDQRVNIASTNPGIEVSGGEVVFDVRGGQLLTVHSGVWPFLGGKLALRPVSIRFGEAEMRSYVFDISGVDAARFIERMELGNLSATGIFDGTIPIVFDATGTGRIVNGVLLSQPPGGNISYVGTLTYENLGVMANYAFDALRSLDYRQMRIQMDGNLTGEIVTKVRFDGVKQGAGAKKNFITREIAKLPFRFDVNIRAPFYSLISSVKAMYDPASVRDPRDLGLVDSEGRVIRRETDGSAPILPAPTSSTPDEATIQRRESEGVP